MTKIKDIFDTPARINFLLFCCSFFIYFFYFHHLFLNLNSVLSSSTGDTIKNYYTFLFHITKDKHALHFSGMNYPFGEHVVYTDCQPLLTFFLRCFPFTYNYLVGIMHTCIIMSLLATPLILNKILLRLDVDRFSAFFISLAIAVMSPQIRRLDGHFALSYDCIIPLEILLLLEVFQENNKRKQALKLAIYNCLLFLIHPYLGFGCSALSFFSTLAFVCLSFRDGQFFKRLLLPIATGLGPVFLFKLFMVLTDKHPGRTIEPDGMDMLVANPASVFVPNFGPFSDLLKRVISDAPQDYEGLSHVGFYTDMLILVFIGLFAFNIKKIQLKKETGSVLLAAIVLLLFSFGIHNQVLSLLNLKISLLNQFRTLGRFAWFFYYIAPLFLAATIIHFLKNGRNQVRVKLLCRIFAVLFFLFNMLEANSLLGFYGKTIFHDRNVFRSEYLNKEETINLENIRAKRPQAIITLPRLFVGSEVYSRNGGDRSMIPAIIYSYHSGLPICGTYLSRTSIGETEAGIDIINTYKKNKNSDQMTTKSPWLVIKTNEELMPDESRLADRTKIFSENDSLKIGYIYPEDLANASFGKNFIQISGNQELNKDSNNVIFIGQQMRKPFLPSKMSDYESAFVLDSHVVRSGQYIVSLHFHFTEKTFRHVYSHLVVVKINQNESVWEVTKPVRLFSGFYKGFAVFEFPIVLHEENRYEFLMYGFGDKSYRISDFLLRPADVDVLHVGATRDTTINNFPFHD